LPCALPGPKDGGFSGRSITITTTTRRLARHSTDAQYNRSAAHPGQCCGPCEFQLARYDEARTYLDQARKLGLGDNTELVRVMRYHDGLLSILKGDLKSRDSRLAQL
jgi:hypothetical protein